MLFAVLMVVCACGAFASGARASVKVPVLGFTPSTASFGPVLAGVKAPAQSFKLKNSGDRATGALTVSLSGSGFAKTRDTCTASSLGPHKTCIVALTYTGTNQGEQDAGTLTAKSRSKAGVSATLPLTGTTPLEADLSIKKVDTTDFIGGANGTFNPSTNNTTGGTDVPGNTGHPLVYTIVIANSGPNSVTGASVSDVMPAGVASDTWSVTSEIGGATVVGGSTSGTGNITGTLDMPANSFITYTVDVTISSSATGTLTNTATVTPPAGVDPNPANNSSTDTITLTPQADLSITKADSTSGFYVPDGSTSYTITVTNSGPSDVLGATISDTMPTAIANDSYSASETGSATGFTATGSGSIKDTVNMPAGSTITYTVNASISGTATGSIANTATVSPPSGVTDPNTANNGVTDTLQQTIADLSIKKVDTTDFIGGVNGTFNPSTNNTTGGTDVPGNTGHPLVYTIVIANSGPNSVTGASVSDVMPAGVASDTWSVTSEIGGATVVGGSTSGTGNITGTLDMPANSFITYTVDVTISSSATGTLTNTATVTPPAGVDPNPANNSSTDTITLT